GRATGGARGVTVANGSRVTMTVPRTVTGTLSVMGPLDGADRLTVQGALRLEAGGSVAGAPGYQADGSLVYGADLTVGSEWGAGSETGAGVPRHVTIDAGAGSVSVPADRVVPGNLTVTSGGIALGSSTLTLRGDLISGA